MFIFFKNLDLFLYRQRARYLSKNTLCRQNFPRIRISVMMDSRQTVRTVHPTVLRNGHHG